MPGRVADYVFAVRQIGGQDVMQLGFEIPPPDRGRPLHLAEAKRRRLGLNDMVPRLAYRSAPPEAPCFGITITGVAERSSRGMPAGRSFFTSLSFRPRSILRMSPRSALV